uniref:Uncharacterized protein n=1 Tax=Chromera velia CCMP2878 TaxID=1169474 RepID=A0A0G4I7I5_9ALVE|eukprot:Cvel_1943.t1-p1 / transcript=Cvel_1943.t1 / gene=Cvel_1943 / organism=Chromera_velia_CCMP2878 / gene_product=Leucine-rich repeat extensin-like protein 5, putative / transcript_product=Leucine-rich repeat extensin-like protein 5, putative / location=Cvel_scaffold73:78146-85595(-) / protein_length=2040 / sequence_SO=supercontig / SO=protein_coding / is_pseudo=false
MQQKAFQSFCHTPSLTPPNNFRWTPQRHYTGASNTGYTLRNSLQSVSPSGQQVGNTNRVRGSYVPVKPQPQKMSLQTAVRGEHVTPMQPSSTPLNGGMVSEGSFGAVCFEQPGSVNQYSDMDPVTLPPTLAHTEMDSRLHTHVADSEGGKETAERPPQGIPVGWVAEQHSFMAQESLRGPTDRQEDTKILRDIPTQQTGDTPAIQFAIHGPEEDEIPAGEEEEEEREAEKSLPRESSLLVRIRQAGNNNSQLPSSSISPQSTRKGRQRLIRCPQPIPSSRPNYAAPTCASTEREKEKEKERDHPQQPTGSKSTKRQTHVKETVRRQRTYPKEKNQEENHEPSSVNNPGVRLAKTTKPKRRTSARRPLFHKAAPPHSLFVLSMPPTTGGDEVSQTAAQPVPASPAEGEVQKTMHPEEDRDPEERSPKEEDGDWESDSEPDHLLSKPVTLQTETEERSFKFPVQRNSQQPQLAMKNYEAAKDSANPAAHVASNAVPPLSESGMNSSHLRSVQETKTLSQVTGHQTRHSGAATAPVSFPAPVPPLPAASWTRGDSSIAAGTCTGTGVCGGWLSGPALTGTSVSSSPYVAPSVEVSNLSGGTSYGPSIAGGLQPGLFQQQQQEGHALLGPDFNAARARGASVEDPQTLYTQAPSSFTFPPGTSARPLFPSLNQQSSQGQNVMIPSLGTHLLSGFAESSFQGNEMRADRETPIVALPLTLPPQPMAGHSQLSLSLSPSDASVSYAIGASTVRDAMGQLTRSLTPSNGPTVSGASPAHQSVRRPTESDADTKTGRSEGVLVSQFFPGYPIGSGVSTHNQTKTQDAEEQKQTAALPSSKGASPRSIQKPSALFLPLSRQRGAAKVPSDPLEKIKWQLEKRRHRTDGGGVLGAESISPFSALAASALAARNPSNKEEKELQKRLEEIITRHQEQRGRRGRRLFLALHREGAARAERLAKRQADNSAAEEAALAQMREDTMVLVRQSSARCVDARGFLERNQDWMEARERYAQLGILKKAAQERQEELACTFKPEVNPVKPGEWRRRGAEGLLRDVAARQRRVIARMRVAFSKRQKTLASLQKAEEAAEKRRDAAATKRVVEFLATPSGVSFLQGKIETVLAGCGPGKRNQSREEIQRQIVEDLVASACKGGALDQNDHRGPRGGEGRGGSSSAIEATAEKTAKFAEELEGVQRRRALAEVEVMVRLLSLEVELQKLDSEGNKLIGSLSAKDRRAADRRGEQHGFILHLPLKLSDLLPEVAALLDEKRTRVDGESPELCAQVEGSDEYDEEGEEERKEEASREGRREVEGEEVKEEGGKAIDVEQILENARVEMEKKRLGLEDGQPESKEGNEEGAGGGGGMGDSLWRLAELVTATASASSTPSGFSLSRALRKLQMIHSESRQSALASRGLLHSKQTTLHSGASGRRGRRLKYGRKGRKSEADSRKKRKSKEESLPSCHPLPVGLQLAEDAAEREACSANAQAEVSKKPTGGESVFLLQADAPHLSQVQGAQSNPQFPFPITFPLPCSRPPMSSVSALQLQYPQPSQPPSNRTSAQGGTNDPYWHQQSARGTYGNPLPSPASCRWGALYGNPPTQSPEQTAPQQEMPSQHQESSGALPIDVSCSPQTAKGTVPQESKRAEVQAVDRGASRRRDMIEGTKPHRQAGREVKSSPSAKEQKSKPLQKKTKGGLLDPVVSLPTTTMKIEVEQPPRKSNAPSVKPPMQPCLDETFSSDINATLPRTRDPLHVPPHALPTNLHHPPNPASLIRNHSQAAAGAGTGRQGGVLRPSGSAPLVSPRGPVMLQVQPANHPFSPTPRGTLMPPQSSLGSLLPIPPQPSPHAVSASGSRHPDPQRYQSLSNLRPTPQAGNQETVPERVQKRLQHPQPFCLPVPPVPCQWGVPRSPPPLQPSPNRPPMQFAFHPSPVSRTSGQASSPMFHQQPALRESHQRHAGAPVMPRHHPHYSSHSPLPGPPHPLQAQRRDGSLNSIPTPRALQQKQARGGNPPSHAHHPHSQMQMRAMWEAFRPVPSRVSTQAPFIHAPPVHPGGRF